MLVRQADLFGMTDGKSFREFKLIVRSLEHGTRILHDPDAPPVSWITREDLFDWIWSMPETKVSAALDVQASWLCNIYRVNRPRMSHWHRVRKGLDAPRDALDPFMPADTPVPLVNFEYAPGGSYAVVPDLLPWMRIGGPDRSGLIYPYDGGHIPAFLAVGTSGRPTRVWSRGPVGPPRLPTVRELRALIWDAEADDIEAQLALMGLSKREIAKIAKRSGLRVPTADWWSVDWHRSSKPHPDGTRPKKLTQSQLDQPIDLTAGTLEQVRKEVHADIAAEEATRLRRSEASRTAVARTRARMEAGYHSVVSALAAGASGQDSCVAAGVNQTTFRAELRRRLRDALTAQPGGSDEADNITGRVMRGTADRYETLLADHVLRRGADKADSNDPQHYSDRTPTTSIPALVRWLVAAEDVVEAQAELSANSSSAPDAVDQDRRGAE